MDNRAWNKKEKNTIALLKKGVVIGVSVVLLLQQESGYAFGQTTTASQSGQSSIIVGTPSALLMPQDASKQAAFLGVNDLLQTITPSASVAQPTVVSRLPKKSYKAEEPVELTVANSPKGSVKVAVIDSYGLDATEKFIIQKFSSGTNTILDVLPPQSRFRPGKYTLKITDSAGNATTQDFTWGVLAINTNKSIYLPQETALIAMAVLDDTGNMVCDADVTLRITDPQNHTTTLSTANGQIVVNDICTKHEFSLTPDYQTLYKVGGAGSYQVTLSASTNNGDYNISDSFAVADSVDFDVSRDSATRLYPPVWYPVTLTITANKDFSGVVTDYVPATFDVKPAASGDTTYTEVKTVYPGGEGPQALFGVGRLQLSLPFTGKHTVEQGFGEQLTDPKERDKYKFYHVLGHDGIDFAMPIGTAVLAADDGVVVRAKENDDYGTTIVIRHTWGQSYYGHLSRLEVTVGQKVKKGQEIAKSGNTGLSSGSHLHFGMKPKNPQIDNGFFGKVDPASYLSLDQADKASWDVTTRLGNQPLKIVEWKVNMKKGDTVSLGYQFKAPNVSPQFYTLGPAHFIDTTGSVLFSELRSWQLAADATVPATIYMSNTASTKLTTTTSWQFVSSAPASANNTTIAQEGRNNTGYIQLAPGATTTTTQATAPTTGNGKGWIFDAGGDTTLVGTSSWVFHVKTTANSAGGTGFITVCVWAITLSGTAIGTSTTISNCQDGATNVQSSTTPQIQTISINPGQFSLTSSQYLYVEFWLHTTVKNGSSSTANVALEVNAGTNDSLVMPAQSSNLSPSAPSISAPTNNATGVNTTPTFTFTGADQESDNLGYKVVIYTTSACAGGTTFDQAISGTGWSNTNATCTNNPTSCYSSGRAASYTLQVANALNAGTQYWWQAAAKDPDGSGAFSSLSSCNTFTTSVAGSTLDQLLRHGEWFNNGVVQPFTF